MKVKVKWGRTIYFLSGIMLLFFFVFAPIKIIPKLLNSNINANLSSVSNDGGFLKLWHIDDFEGGSGNRAKFLEEVGQQFEKKFQGWYVVVQTLTAEEVFNSITKGDVPDLISFSHYSGYMLQDVLSDYQGAVSARDDLVAYGKLNGKIKAIPWYLSGYCLIGNSGANSAVLETLSPQTMFSYGVNGKKSYTPSLATGLANNNLAFLSALKNGANMGSTTELTNNFDTATTFEAYNDFCNKNSATVLLGTARDFYRVQNKISLGNMPECKFVPLGGFTDLVGYIGVCSNKKNNQEKTNEFIEYLTTDNVQKQLNKIGLFSTTYQEIYKDNAHYSAFEKVLHRNVSSINVFTSQSDKEELFKHSINAILGNADSLKFVKKYI